MTNNFLGKILRVDVNGDDFPGTTPEALSKNYTIPPTNPFVATMGDDEIWRTAFAIRFVPVSIGVTHDLWIGDVGQDDREEIDFQPASSTGGENYGWRFREGDIATPTPLDSPVGGPPPADYVPPVYSYTHITTNVSPASPTGFNGNVVTGGYVYRGPDPSLQGKYFFLDSVSKNYWMVDASPFGTVENINPSMVPDTGLAALPVSFGEDAVGNLYIAYLASNELYRIGTNQLLIGDFDADGDVDADDYTRFRTRFAAAADNPPADGNANALFDTADFVAWRKNLGASVHPGAGAGAGPPVPEPRTTLLVLAGLTVGWPCAHRRRL